MSNNNNGRQDLSTPRSGQEREVTEVLHHFTVEAWTEGQYRTLLAGDLFPVYDLEAWKMINNFQATAHNAVRRGDRIICHSGDTTSPEEAALYELVRAEGPDSQRTQDIMARMRLGNVGGKRVIRPDYLPVGVLPGLVHTANGMYTHEWVPMSALDWAYETSDEIGGLPQINGVPDLGWWMECGTGGREGFDITTEKLLTVAPVALPFTWSTLYENELVMPDEDETSGSRRTREDMFIMKLSGAIRQARETHGWTGRVYVGYGLPAVDGYEGNTAPNSAGVVYHQPYYKDRTMDVFDDRAVEKVKTLLEGRAYTGPRLRRGTVSGFAGSLTEHEVAVTA